jgi:NADH-quinone oxidoreductase subunit G
VNSQPIKLKRQASTFVQIPAGVEGAFARYIAGEDAAADSITGSSLTREQLAAVRDKLKAEQNLVVVFGSEIRGTDVEALVSFNSGAKFICLGDYANSRGAADMGVAPDLLPGYAPVAGGTEFHKEWGEVPTTPGLTIPQMFDAAKSGKLKGLLVVGSNPISRYGIDPYSLHGPFVVVQDMFLTETALTADVVLPVLNAYEKSGTFTNTCGDLQLLKKAGEVSGLKSDFEIIVRIAAAMGFDVKKLVPFGGGVHADMGQSRGAQSGEADRHAVWLQAHGLEPKMSPFDPMAVLDEIQRLVPGYDVSRINLLSGNDEQTKLVQIDLGNYQSRADLVVPSNDTLFTSGTLGRYSNTMNSVIERSTKDSEVMAD